MVQAEPGDLLTVPEAAALLRVYRATVYRLVQSQVIVAIRVSNAFRIPAVALDGMRSQPHQLNR